MNKPVSPDQLESLKRAVKLKRLQAQNKEKKAGAERAIAPVERSAALPLSWAQQRLWFLDKFDAAAGAAYHLPAGFRLQGELDRNALKTALDLLTARHESLRTTFVTLDGQAVQVIGAADIGFAMSEHDLSGLGKDEQARVVARIQADTFSTPFDLAQGPLVRAQLLRLGAQDHLFLLNQHHIVTDGWSIGVLISEMGALYSALRQGRANPLPPLPIQYADYAAWQRAWLQGDALAAQIDYWKQHLDQAPELLALPTDRPRPAVQSHAGGRIDGVFSAELSRAIKQLGQRHGTTLYMTLLAGWAILMARLSAQSEVVIGTPIANRERAGTEGLIGFFVNTLALRFSTEGEPTVAEFLAQVKTHTLNAYAHQDLPFEQVVEALKPTRSLAYNPLFQTMLTMNDAGQGPLQLPGLQLAPLEFDSTSTHFDLHPTLTEGQDGIVCHLAYASELFDESTVRQCFERYRRVLEAMVADAAMPLSRIALTSAEERQMLLADFNRTTVAYPHEQLIHRLFEAQAAAHPQAMAVVSGAHGLSYGELNRRANQLAHALIDMGVKPDQRVALCVERSVEMAVGLLGILKSGAAYVPMEALQPRERLGYLLADSGARVLLTQAALVAGLPSCTMPVWTLDTDAFCHAAQHDPDPAQLGLHSHHLAYVIYTSGSTGAAKGVMVEHHSALNFWQAMKGSTHQSLPAQARVALNASYAFDMSWKGWLQLLSGHCVHLIPQAIRADGKQVMQFLEQHCIDVFDSTPSQLELLLDAGLLERGDYHYHPRAVLLGGEAIAPAMWARLQQARHIEFFNMYGPTEATVDATLGRIEPDAPRPHIGRPLDNAQIYILDAHLEPLPLGIAGEIYIGGAGVARGYLDRPELTAERFPANPFGAGRLYKTGDLGRWLADGNLDYLGRNDFQVKIRGFRIELGEIEAALRELPQVREALVLAHPEQPTQRLVAYLVPHAGAQLELAELRHALATRLAEHMVPSAFVMLDKFPLTANGKLDRRALPAPDADAMAGEPYQAPRGANETALAQVWQALLDLRRVGRDDHFFALGGHSLLVIDMLEELRTHQLALDMQLVFANLSLAELAAATTPLEAEAQPAAAPALIAPGCTQITPALLPLLSLSQPEIDGLVARVDGGSANIQDIYPLVPLQEGILFHYLLESEGDPYLSRSVLSFDTRARLDSFLLALQQVIDRHDILRSAVFWEGLPQPLQVVCRQAPLPVHALTPASGEDSLAQLLRHSDPRRLRLDLGRAPLLAAYTIALADSGEYLLAILNQHMVSDHVSLESIMGEIHLLLQGQAERLAPPIPFRNFIAASRAVSVVEHQAYFERELGGVSEATTPFGIVDTQGSGAVLDQTRLELSDDLAQKIRAAARQHGVSPAVLFHLAWGQVLAACTGQDDVVFGTVLSGRMRGSDGVGQAVGLFLNTLPLRVSVGRLPAQAAVAQCGRRLNELLVHEQASLVLAQRCSGVPAGQPLFSTLLNYRHSPAAANGVAQWQGMRQLAAEERSNYPISASVDDRGRGFGLTVQAAGVASDRMADYLQRGIEALANALIVAPQTNLCTLPLLPPAETQRLLRDFNDTAHDYPHEALIHGRFEQHAASHPDAIALVAGAVSVSYGALNRRANRLAHRLLALGIKPDGRVAICAAREVDMVVAMLATLKAGAGYVPLDPAYPADRLAYLLEDSAPQVLLVRGALRAQFPGSVPVLCLDDEAQLDACPDHNPEVPGLSARNLGYVIYTSGSTGQPKGVMVEHRNVLALVVNKPDVGIVATDCMAHCASPAFDASSWELWAALLNGARVLLVPQEILLDPRRFNDTLLAGGVSVLFLTVGVFNAYLDVLKPAFARLRLLLIGGDALDPRSVARALLAPAPGQLINLYGPTETTTFSTSHRIEAVAADARSIPLGRPIGNTQIYLLDAHLRPVPFGVAGEIHIAGAGVARGYFNRPALTEERFLADPFSAQPDARMYKTGDLGRWLADGTVEYLGRNDFQVKIRGFRIEPGEIEAQLVRCAGVREAVVLAREDVPGDKRLVAYLIGTPASAAELRAELGQTLAEYMLPAAFVTLERFPLTPHGKLDRKALPAPDQAAVAARAYQAPQGEVETALARIWSELLAVQQVGRDDNFFALGGHSLLAVQLISRIRSGMGLEANLRDLFTRPTLAAFAVSLAQARQSTLGAIPLAERGARLPLSWAQQRLWFLGRLDAAAGAAYHVPAALRLSGRLDTPALRATLDRIVARHEILRTTFVMAEGEPAQSIGRADIGFALDEQDLSALGAAAQPGMVDAIGKQFFSLPFELEQGPLIAGRLLRLAPDEHVLLINQHHIVTDGWSIEVLVREVTSLYTAFSQGQADPLAPLAIQYADYAAWQRNWLQGAALQGQLDYWTGQLSGAPELLALPTDRPRPAVQSYAGDALAFTIPAPLSAGLKQLGARHGATLFMTLLAGWGILMARLSGQTDVVVGSPVANRQRSEVEPMIGFFVNTLALRIDTEGAPSVAELLAKVRGLTLDAYAHQDVPFEQVVDALKPTRSLSHSPLFQTLLTLNQASERGELVLPGLRLSGVERKHETAHFDLALGVTEAHEQLHGHMTYATALFDGDTIARLARCYVAVLGEMVADDSQSVARLQLLSDAERRQLTQGFNDTARPYPDDKLIHQLFEAHAARTPEALALVFGEASLSYAQLNRKANQLAHRLRALGIGPDQLVAVAAERSLEMVIGVLAVLKAGAAFVPIDPSLPPERIAYMLADSAPKALLVQAPLRALLPPCAMPVLLLDAQAESADADADAGTGADGNLAPAALGMTPDNLAYVIYTSGSTGMPKGVQNHHRGLCNLIPALNEVYAIGPDSRLLQFVSFGFDVCVSDLMMALCSGASLHLAPKEALLGEALLHTLRRHAISHVGIPVGVLAALPADADLGLQTLITGGDVLSASLAQQWSRGQLLVNSYGPTEATVCSTVYACSPNQAGAVPIGKPLPNTQLYILDDLLQAVPLGVAGEIYIGGLGVARGYLNRAELTAERFLVNPFGPGRLYKTGDLGRWLADGNVEFLGRKDFQVKIRGFRIELGEIEARLAQCRGVREAVVLARQDQPGEKRLVAYLTGTPGSAAELRAELSTQLADYMLPAAFVVLDQLPLTSNGKIDRQALPAPDMTAAALRQYAAPQGELECVVAGIWQDLLGLARVGRNDHFFELGGHSLLAVQLMTRIRASLGLEVELRELFAHPVLGDFATALGQARRAATTAIPLADRGAGLPLSWA
ncbi:amino acid adenylation domain-containing protein, partial [Rugamonas sp. CCM 8940]